MSALVRIVRRVAVVLACILVMLVILLLALPVALLPVSTSVPVFVWILCAIMDAALMVALFRFRWTNRAISVAVIGSLIVALIAVVTSQVFASTPPIAGANSIAILERVTLNGSEQWISIRGKDVRNPVLLFLAGGPGGTDMAVTRITLGGLEEHFVVVNWDQPGAGKSYHAVPHAALTPERYIADAHELTLYLRQRFGQARIYVLGESWGSVLGVWLVQRYPELFHAFIGTGQMVAFKENDILCYEFALRWARERGDAQKVEQLERLGPPPYYGQGVAQKEAAFLLDTYAYMNQNPAVIRAGNTLRDMAGQEYGLYDKLNYVRGALETLNVVYPQLWEVDLRTQSPHLDVPVYFLKGRHDVNAPTSLTEEYFQLLSAPHKELIWFERSGHNPWISEPELFVDVMVSRVLAHAQPAPTDSGK
jgi:pimeloyl-ACP methyl ester carboxylesterase